MATREALKRADAARKAARKYAEDRCEVAEQRIISAANLIPRSVVPRRYLESAFSAGIAYAERRAKREAKGGKA